MWERANLKARMIANMFTTVIRSYVHISGSSNSFNSCFWSFKSQHNRV